MFKFVQVEELMASLSTARAKVNCCCLKTPLISMKCTVVYEKLCYVNPYFHITFASHGYSASKDYLLLDSIHKCPMLH